MWLPLFVAWDPVVYGAANPVVTVIAGTTGAAVVTAVATYVLSRRRESGSVRPSNAAELWGAYDRVMERVESDNRGLREEVSKLRERVAVLERDNARIPALEHEIERLRGIVNGT